jgi:hypothetical protein
MEKSILIPSGHKVAQNNQPEPEIITRKRISRPWVAALSRGFLPSSQSCLSPYLDCHIRSHPYDQSPSVLISLDIDSHDLTYTPPDMPRPQKALFPVSGSVLWPRMPHLCCSAHLSSWFMVSEECHLGDAPKTSSSLIAPSQDIPRPRLSYPSYQEETKGQRQWGMIGLQGSC